MEGSVQDVVKEVSEFDVKNVDDFLERSSKLCVSLSLYSKLIFEIVPGSQRPLSLDNDQVTAREGWDDANHNLFSILSFMTSGPAFSAVRRFEGKTREDGSRAWTGRMGSSTREVRWLLARGLASGALGVGNGENVVR